MTCKIVNTTRSFGSDPSSHEEILTPLFKRDHGISHIHLDNLINPWAHKVLRKEREISLEFRCCE